MTSLRAVLFDLDGTLADTAPDLAHVLNTLLGEEGRAPLPYARIRSQVSHGGKALIHLGFGLDEQDPEFARLRKRFLELYRDNLCNRTRLFPGMEQTLRALEGRGLRWGIVTNKPASLTDPLVQQLGLTDRAACVVSGDTTANSKPHPEPMLHACRLAGAAAGQCLYVGDAARDIEAGRRAGMHTLVALFGYIGDDDRPADWGADGAVESPAGITEWIERHV